MDDANSKEPTEKGAEREQRAPGGAPGGLSRRRFVGGIGAAALAGSAGGALARLLAGCGSSGTGVRDTGAEGGDGEAGDAEAGEGEGGEAEGGAEDGATTPARPNILLVTTDQEHPPYWFRHDQAWVDERLPARAFLRRWGVQFTGVHSVAMPCSPSRASLYSGVYTHQHHVYGNAGMAGVFLPHFPTCASILKERFGYRTFYAGKSHLKAMNTYECGTDPKGSMREYGFDEWLTAPSEPYVGTWPEGQCYDSVGIPYEGEHEDPVFADAAIEWLRRPETGDPAAGPWFGIVSLVNPHDIMHYPTFEPRDYAVEVDDRPGNFEDKEDVEANKPTCQGEYIEMYNFTTAGPMPHRPLSRKWDTMPDAYLYLLRACDAEIRRVLDAVFALPPEVRDNLVVLFTSDHGEMLGAHGQRAKRPNMYEEQQNVPLFVVDFSAPALRALRAFPTAAPPSGTPGGSYADALLGSTRNQLGTLLDVAPTIVSLAAAGDADPESWRADQPQLQGANLVPLLQAAGESAAPRAPDAAGALVERRHILATCDQGYEVPGEADPVAVHTAFHIVSLRRQTRDADGRITADSS
jgi:arylsulfatase